MLGNCSGSFMVLILQMRLSRSIPTRSVGLADSHLQAYWKSEPSGQGKVLVRSPLRWHLFGRFCLGLFGGRLLVWKNGLGQTSLHDDGLSRWTQKHTRSSSQSCPLVAPGTRVSVLGYTSAVTESRFVLKFSYSWLPSNTALIICFYCFFENIPCLDVSF